MIIKSSRLRTVYGPKQTLNHICRGEDNIEVLIVQGEETWVEDAFIHADAHGREYALRSVKFNPQKVGTTIEQLVEAAREYAEEFGLDFPSAFLVAHHKARVKADPDGADTCDWHLHALYRDYDLESGTVADDSNSWKRNELLARRFEHRHRHDFVEGVHTAWVIKRLIKADDLDLAKALSDAFPGKRKRPKAPLDTVTIQKLKREGFSATALLAHLRTDWRETTTADDFLSRVSARGMTVTKGERDPPSWIVTANGEFLCSLAGALKGVSILTINARLGAPYARTNDPVPPAGTDAAPPAVARPADRGAAARSERDARADDRDAAGTVVRAGDEAIRWDDERDERDRSDDDDRRAADRDLERSEGHRAVAQDPARAAGADDRPYPGSPRLEIGAGRSLAPRGRLALIACRRMLADASAIIRRAAETPYDRAARALDGMEANALADQITANVQPSKELLKARRLLERLDKRRTETAARLRVREDRLAKLSDHIPTWMERMTGSHQRAVEKATMIRDKAKVRHEEVVTAREFRGNWNALLETAYTNEVAAAVPVAANAARNMKIVLQARTLMADVPRSVRLGPTAFIAEAAIRAGFKKHDSETEREADELPTGDLRYRFNHWGLPLD